MNEKNILASIIPAGATKAELTFMKNWLLLQLGFTCTAEAALSSVVHAGGVVTPIAGALPKKRGRKPKIVSNVAVAA